MILKTSLKKTAPKMDATIRSVIFTGQKKKQAGATLMEIIAYLAIAGVVVVGAVALFGSASASERATAMQRDISALQAATRSLYAGQGGYGAGSINQVLVSAKKIPSTLNVTGTNKINHRDNGEFTITGANQTFTIAVTKVAKEICIPLLTNASGWGKVKVGTAADITAFPITPTQAETSCQADNTVTFTD